MSRFTDRFKKESSILFEYEVNAPIIGAPILTDLVNGVFTLNNHGLSNNNSQGFTDCITFKANEGGTLPSGIIEGVGYLINNDTQNTFTIMDDAYNDINNFTSAGSNYEIRIAGAYSIAFGSTANPLQLEKGYSYTFVVYIYPPENGIFIFKNNNKIIRTLIPISFSANEKWSLDFVFGEHLSYAYVTQESNDVNLRISTNTMRDDFINILSFEALTYIPNGTKLYLLRR